jgi:cyclopropane-fatty-acyl-phospholipid synthase
MTDLSFDGSAACESVSPDFGWLSRRLSGTLLSRIHSGRLTIITPSGMRITAGHDDGGPHGILVLRRWRTLRRLVFQGDISFAEAFIDGDWDSPDLPALVELAGRNLPTLSDAFDANWYHRLRNRVLHRLNANTRRGSKRNIQHHYDLGNSFYRTWLDSGMSYSSALFTTAKQTLEQAQTAKQQRAIALMQVAGGERVLEIGCGWGGLAEQLVRSAGCHVIGVTLSPAQLEYASARQLGAQADLRLQDYRDVGGMFNRIVSIEMMEAVGESYWPSYFSTLHDRRRAVGAAGHHHRRSAFRGLPPLHRLHPALHLPRRDAADGVGDPPPDRTGRIAAAVDGAFRRQLRAHPGRVAPPLPWRLAGNRAAGL